MDCLPAACGVCCQSGRVVEQQHALWKEKERSSRSCTRQGVFRRASPPGTIWPGKDSGWGAGAWRGGGFCKVGEGPRIRNGQLFVAGQHTASVISAQSLEQAQHFMHQGEDGLVDAPCVTVEKMGKNKRRIAASISIGAPLETVWGILTNYNRLADFIPGLAVSELLEKGHHRALIRQVGKQDLAFGIMFKAEAVMEITEHPLEIRNGVRRNLDFQMVKGDFELFSGTWTMEEARCEVSTTLLTYVVEVQPKIWLPVGLLESRLSNDIKLNLMCIRDAARA